MLGEHAYPSLLDIPEDVQWTWSTCSGGRRRRPDVARDAVAIGARVLWLQAGIVNEEAYRIATDGGLEVIMGVCIRSTIKRLDPTEG